MIATIRLSLLLAAVGTSAQAEEGEAHQTLVDLHVMIGTEPHNQGNPIAFGAGGELLWRRRVGAFAALYASAGSPIRVASGVGLGDRVSVPFGLAVRPFLAPQTTYLDRLAAGLGLQVGATVEHLRTSLDDKTTAGLHLGISVELPFYGCLDGQSGVALRLFGRMLFTPPVTLANQLVAEPAVNGQFFLGLAFYP